MVPTKPAFAIGFAGGEFDEDGHRLGFIRIGDLSEEFVVAPESGDPGEAWILYREGDTVFIPEKLFVPSDFGPLLDADLQLLHIPPRTTVTEDGTTVSEWRIIAAIEDFLRHSGIRS